MQKFYASFDRIAVHQVMQMLQDAGIPVLLKNDFIQGAIGEIPAVDNDIEVWLVDDEWRSRADALLAQWEADRDVQGYAWVCTECGEDNAAEFGVCWSCQASRP